MDSSNESDSVKDEEMLLKKRKMKKENEESISNEDEESISKEDEESISKEDEESISKEDEKSISKEDEKSISKEDKKCISKEDEKSSESSEEGEEHKEHEDTDEGYSGVSSEDETEHGIYFPSEIVEKIIDYVDGKTLATTRLVSTSWKAIADRRLRRQNHIWIDFCISEIPIEQIHDFLNHHDPKYFLRTSPIPEMSKVYKRWHLWQSFLSLDKNLFHVIVGGDSPICEIKCSGDYILIGTSNGLYCYNYLYGVVKRLIFFGIDNYGSVKWFSLRSTIVEPNVGDGAFSGMGHDIVTFELDSEVYEFSFFPTLKLKKLYEKRFPVISKHYVAQNDIQVFLESTRYNCTIHIVMNSGRTMSKFYDTTFKLLTLYHSFIMLYDYNLHKVRIIDLNFNELTVHPLYNVTLRERWNLDHYVVGLDAIITYSIGGDPEPLSVKVGRSSLVMPTLHYVTSVRFYANHLFLGTRNGAIVVFLIKTLEELLQLEDPIMQQPERKEIFQLSDYKIIAIDVRESAPASSIIAATATDIFEIRFSLLQNLSDICIKQFLP